MKRKIIISPDYKHLKEYIEAIPRDFDHLGTLIHDGRNQIRVVKAGGQTINIKKYGRPRFINRYIYSLYLRKPKGYRAFVYPSLLKERGIDSPDSIAYIEDRKMGIITDSYYISIHGKSNVNLYDMGHDKEGQMDDTAVALARFTADVHEAGVMHLDYSPGNMLCLKDEEGGHHFSLIDTNRMYFGKVGIKKGCSNFARIWATKKTVCKMARVYAAQRGYDPGECERLVLKYRRLFWKKFILKHKPGYDVEL